MSNKYLVGIFSDEDQLVHTVYELRKRNVDIHDVFTPFPLHGLDDSLKIVRTRLPIITFLAGGTGLLLATWFQYWTSAVDWPINVGGKSYNSFPAFVPVAFEITVLLGALTTVFFFLFRSKLFPGKKPVILSPGQNR